MLYPDATIAVIICIIFPILSGIAVALRTYSQKILLGHSFRTDDYLIMAGQTIAVGICIMSIYAACKAGFGWPLEEIGKAGVEETFGKMVLASHVLWGSGVSMVRIGLLFYYRRLFSSTRTFRIADTILIFISLGWVLVLILTTTISFSWDSTVGQEKYSINFFGYQIAMTALNVALDTATVALPACVISRLRLSLKKKIMVAGIFCLGIICIVASLSRLYYITIFYRTAHPSPELAANTIFYAWIWAIIEPCVSVIAASLPTYTPIIKKVSTSSIFKALGPWSRSSKNKVKENKTNGTATLVAGAKSEVGKMPGFGSRDLHEMNAVPVVKEMA